MVFAERIEHVVLQQSGTQASREQWPALQPQAMARDTVRWSDLLGTNYSGEAINAYFDLTPLGQDEFAVIVILTGGERRFHVGHGDRRKIQ